MCGIFISAYLKGAVEFPRFESALFSNSLNSKYPSYALPGNFEICTGVISLPDALTDQKGVKTRTKLKNQIYQESN